MQLVFLFKECTVDVDQALFQPFPSEIVFQKFHPHQTIEVPLTFRNLDRVSIKLITCNCVCTNKLAAS